MRVRSSITTLVFSVFLIFNLSAQTETTEAADVQESSPAVAKQVDDAFEQLIKESNNFQNYKVVKVNSLLELQKDTKNKIENLESNITQLNSKINDLQGQVDASKKELDETNSTLEEVEKSKNEFSFLGIKMMKGTYQVIVIIIIVILLVFLILFIGKFKASNSGTIKAKNDLKDLQDDYDEYRRKALETQQRLGRQLQDERNKNVE